MGQVSLPALLVELAVATKQTKTREEQGSLGMASPSWAGGCQPGQSQQCHSPLEDPAPLLGDLLPFSQEKGKH